MRFTDDPSDFDSLRKILLESLKKRKSSHYSSSFMRTNVVPLFPRAIRRLGDIYVISIHPFTASLNSGDLNGTGYGI